MAPNYCAGGHSANSLNTFLFSIKKNTETNLNPAIISTAALKFPIFQHMDRSLNIHDSTAFLSSCVGCVTIMWVIQPLTWYQTMM